MTTPGRNDPCPCGSGKKYKKCCGAPARGPGREPEASAVALALGHLDAQHRRSLDEACGDFFGCIDDLELPDLDPDVAEMIEINLYEWVLAEGELMVGGRPSSAFAIVTGPKGPPLTPAERGALEELAVRPLRLYEVVSVKPGESLVVRDVAEPGVEPVTVAEKSASRTLVAGDAVGLRLVRRQRDDAWVLSGAIYPLARVELQPLRERIRELEEELGWDDARYLVSDLIVASWLRSLDPRLPDIIDAATGEKVLMTTDHYQIRDRAALERCLATARGLEGDAETGWNRVEGETSRILWQLSIEGDALVVFANTMGRADESRAWLREVAGDAVAFRIREHADPLSPKVRREVGERPGGEVVLPTEAYEQVYRQTYAEWADEPIPALEGATPRQAIETPLGRERVIELIRSYEHAERRQASDQGREPVAFDFLWRQIGLEAPES